jgi:transcriptional regulator with XRE-family HTH domain
MRHNLKLLPVHSRMARAALNWSSQQLANKANVGLNTVSRFENGDADSLSDISSEKIVTTFTNAGVVFLHEANGRGIGVQMQAPQTHILHRPDWIEHRDWIAFRVLTGGRPVIPFVSRQILDDLDGYDGRKRSAQQFLESFERHRELILSVVSKVALKAGRVAPDEHLHLKTSDFPKGAL